MLQYIINSSMIWLACLVMYELLLRKESFHQYNRAYLIVSLVAGLLLPTAKLSSLIPANNTVLNKPTQQVYEIKKAVLIGEPVAAVNAPVTAVATAKPQVSAELILWSVYLLGVAIGIILMTREGFQLARLYSRGIKSSEEGSVIVETGKTHCAFSFFNIIFINSRQSYDESEWALLIAHEKEHGRQMHSIDNLLLISLRIIFWFHPLPHIYYKRLRIVHEFQADKVAATDTTDYGTFLLEQSLLQGAPILTHSINYSPIKNRIAMLTGTRSRRAKLLKYFAIIPLSFVLILFCTQTSFSGESNRKGSKIVFKGNEIEFGTYKVYPQEYAEVLQKQKDAFQYAPLPDSFPAKNWVTGEITMMPVPLDTIPVAINGRPIYGDEAKYKFVQPSPGYAPPAYNGPEKDPEHYLFSSLKNDLEKLENGLYTLNINNVVLDNNGRIAYYEYEGLIARPYGGRLVPAIPNDLRNSINAKTTGILDGEINFAPVKVKDGKPVNVRLQLNTYEIEIRNHKAKLVQRRGC
jgi:beta-lactamase regulating signal transducer with metallopeptidase domain